MDTDSLFLEDDPAYTERILKRLENSGQMRLYTQTLLTLADVMKEREKYPQALNYYLRASRVYEDLEEREKEAEVFEKVGRLYTVWELHEKALEFFLKSYQLRKKLGESDSDMQELLEKIGFSYSETEQYEKTIPYFERLVEVYQANNETYALRQKYKQLADVCKILDRYEKARDYTLDILDLDRKLGDSSQVAATLNNLGFLYKFLEEPRTSRYYFQQSLKRYQELLGEDARTRPVEQRRFSVILDNLGFLEMYLGNNESARDYFEQGLAYKKELGDSTGLAESYNNLALAHLLLKNYYPAKNYAENALRIADKTGATSVRLDSYQQLARLHETLKQFRKALDFQKKYSQAREKVFEQRRAELQQDFERRYVSEKQEKNTRLMVIDREIDNLNVQRLELEAEQKEKNLEILKKEKRLQEYMIRQKQLERARAVQELEIARRQLESEKKDNRIQALARESEIRKRNLELQRAKEKERDKEIELLESRQEISQLKLEEQERERQLFIAIGVLLGLVLLLAIIGFIQKQRSNHKLKRQSNEIQQKNEELASQKEELQLTANQLQQANQQVVSKNDELEEKNKRITDSIRYANTIQTAILPTFEELGTHFQDFFILYRPKDIVSGDFYWFLHVPKEKISPNAEHDYDFIAVVDCTGHGVPGAFMSMIGHTLLNEIVSEMNCHDPAEILRLLDQEIRDGLRQEQEKANQDGMDLSLCRLERRADGEQVEVVFAGAKRSLYVIPQEAGQLERIKGSNRSVGGKERKARKRKFDTEIRLLQPGDLIYMSTDGYADQCNTKLVKFGSHNLRALIEQHHQKPLSKQHLLLEQALDKHQESAEQRDDITLLGLRV